MKMQPTPENIEAIAERIASKELTIETAAEETHWEVWEDNYGNDYLVPSPDRVYADDGNAEVSYDGMSEEDVARTYAYDGDWGVYKTTTWVTIYTWREAIDDEGNIVELGRDIHTVAIDPNEPRCSEEDHDWQRPHKIVGGIEDNPGVQGHGGGVYITEVCMHCGCKKVTDSWAQNPETGEQGLDSVSYEPRYYEDEVEALRESDEDDTDDDE